MKRAAITYRRVSTDRQASEGHSLAVQREAVQNYAALRGFSVIKHCEDAGKSARSRHERPGLDEAISLARERKGVLVVYSLSRLSRSVIDAANILQELRGAGADLAVVDCQIDTSTASGQLVFNVISAIAQFESQLIGERIRDVNARTTREKGFRTQGVQPAGWAYKNGQRVKVPEEWAVIDRVVALSKKHKPAVVAEMLEAGGVKTITQLRGVVNASGWTPKKVYEILQRAKGAQ